MPIAPEHLALIYKGPFDAYLYGRASRDPKKKGRSVTSQLEEGRTLCVENEWPIKREFRDVDRSASRYARKAREEFEEMIEGIESGDCRILVAWEASRYYRDLEVYIRLRNACMANGVLLCYNGTVYDLSKRSDRKATAQDALQAEDEAEGIRERNLRTARLNAMAGTPQGKLLWGYARRYDQDTGELVEQYVHPVRGPIVLDIFQRVAAGESEYSIVRRLRSEGEWMPGQRWEQHHIKNMLNNIGYKGRRIHNGKDVGKASWPAIVPDELFAAVQQILKAPDRAGRRSWAAVHLQSNIADCGACETHPYLRTTANRGTPTYQCPEGFDVSMAEAKMDAYVEEAVIRYLESKAAAAAFASTDDQQRMAAARLRVEQLQAQLDEARELAGKVSSAGKPMLSVASLAALEESLTPQIDEARRDSEKFSAPPVLRSLIGQPDVDAVWQEMTIEQKRAVLRAVVNIRLNPARATGVRKIEPGRITLTFYGEPGFVSSAHRVRAGLPRQRAAEPQG